MRGVWVLAAWLLIAPPAAAATEQTVSLAGLQVMTWAPDDTASGLPVVVFSHGFHGCASQARRLMAAIADAGYLVLTPNHSDAVCDGTAERRPDGPQVPWDADAAWSEATHRDRADDIRWLIAALRDDPAWRAHADLARLALAGHSLGGYTVLGLAGAWPGWKLGGVKAVLALSPYLRPFTTQRTLGGLDAPVMYQGGTRDHWITPDVQQPDGAYDQSPAPKYYVAFRDAGHLAWGDAEPKAHAAIIAYAVAFLDRYVKGLAAEAILTQHTPAVAAQRYESELGSSGAETAEVEPPPKSVRQRLRALLGR